MVFVKSDDAEEVLDTSIAGFGVLRYHGWLHNRLLIVDASLILSQSQICISEHSLDTQRWVFDISVRRDGTWDHDLGVHAVPLGL